MRRAFAYLLIGLPAAAFGCSEIAGLGDFVDVSGVGGHGGSGALGGGGANTGGSGGAAGAGGAGAGSCEPASGSAWSAVMAGANSQQANAAAVDPCTGNLVVVGRMAGDFRVGSTDVPFGGDGSVDMFLLGFGADSNTLVGSHVYGGGEGDLYPVAVAIGPDQSIVVTGRMVASTSIGGVELAAFGMSDIFLSKFSAEGTHEWSYSFGSDEPDLVQALAIDPETGDIYIGGSLTAPVNFDVNKSWVPMAFEDGFVAKFAPDGAAQWVAQYGGLGSSQLVDDLVIHQGRLFVAGHFLDGIRLEPDGPELLPINGSRDLFIHELNMDNGAAVPNQFRTVGGLGEETYARLASSGNALLLGFGFAKDLTTDCGVLVSSCPACATEQDIAVVAFDDQLACQWQDQLGDPSDQSILDVSAYGDGGFMVTGTFDGSIVTNDGPQITSSGMPDLFAVPYDASGESGPAQSFLFEGPASVALALASGPNGESVLAGSFDAITLPDAGAIMANGGGTDGFVLRLLPP